MENKPIVGTSELARRLRRHGITRRWIEEETKAGRLPCLRVGKRVIFNADAVERAIAERAAGSEVAK